MSIDAIDPIEGTVHLTNRWLRELMDELGWEDRAKAYRALRSVLHALRDRLTEAEVVDLGAQLPMLVRGLYYEGWTTGGRPGPVRTREAFLARIADAFRDEPALYPEAVAWAVFKILSRHVSAGEIGDVKGVLPAAIRALWPEGEVARGS